MSIEAWMEFESSTALNGIVRKNEPNLQDNECATDTTSRDLNPTCYDLRIVIEEEVN